MLMKLIDRATCAVLISLIGGTTVTVAYAQKVPNQNVNFSSSLEKQISPEQQDSLEKNDALPLLGKSILNYVKGSVYQTESELELDAKSNAGDRLNLTGKITAITQYPNNYRIDFAFVKPDGTVGNRYLLISNGKDVWLYQPNSQQYLVTSVTDFEQSDDSWIIGFSNLFYLNTPEEIKEQIDRDSINVEDLAQNFLTSTNSSLQQETQEIAGEKYELYQFISQDKALQFSFLVGQTSEKISQFATHNQDRDLNLTITEKILSREENPPIDNETFSFSPPTGATQVDSLSVEPF